MNVFDRRGESCDYVKKLRNTVSIESTPDNSPIDFSCIAPTRDVFILPWIDTVSDDCYSAVPALEVI